MRKKKKIDNKLFLNPNDYCKEIATNISTYINRNFDMINISSKEIDNMFMLIHHHTKNELGFNTEPNDESISENIEDIFENTESNV